MPTTPTPTATYATGDRVTFNGALAGTVTALTTDPRGRAACTITWDNGTTSTTPARDLMPAAPATPTSRRRIGKDRLITLLAEHEATTHGGLPTTYWKRHLRHVPVAELTARAQRLNLI